MVPVYTKQFLVAQAGDSTERLEELQEQERDQLVHALKAKWDTVNKKYQLRVSSERPKAKPDGRATVWSCTGWAVLQPRFELCRGGVQR